jgi:MoxR-like ATPase
MNDETNTIQRAGELLTKLRESIGHALVGQRTVVDQAIIALCVSGHVLIEGVPGLGKTLLVRALAQAMSLKVARIQFTPDLMPSDITGHAVLDSATRELRIVRGPVFTNLLLADEINRAPDRRCRCRGRSSCSRPRIPSKPKGPIRSRRRNSTDSS